jgi:hypothetical protein
VQKVEPKVGVYLPAAQLEHAMAPAAENVPGTHCIEHWLLAPACVEK